MFRHVGAPSRQPYWPKTGSAWIVTQCCLHSVLIAMLFELEQKCCTCHLEDMGSLTARPHLHCAGQSHAAIRLLRVQWLVDAGSPGVVLLDGLQAAADQRLNAMSGKAIQIGDRHVNALAVMLSTR